LTSVLTTEVFVYPKSSKKLFGSSPVWLQITPAQLKLKV